MTEETIALIERAGATFGKDLEAMDDATLALRPGGKARTAYDIVWEVILLNNSYGSAMDGGPGTVYGEGFPLCPSDMQSKPAITKAYHDSLDRVLAAARSVTEADLERPVTTPFGAFALAGVSSMLSRHLMYHSGQLNYIQTIAGDDQIHW